VLGWRHRESLLPASMTTSPRHLPLFLLPSAKRIPLFTTSIPVISLQRFLLLLLFFPLFCLLLQVQEFNILHKVAQMHDRAPGTFNICTPTMTSQHQTFWALLDPPPHLPHIPLFLCQSHHQHVRYAASLVVHILPFQVRCSAVYRSYLSKEGQHCQSAKFLPP
jgi:hypothetical protein